MFYWFTPYDILLIPAILLTLWAQAKVKGAYAKYSKIGVRSGITGADVARRVLLDAGIDAELTRGGEPSPGAIGIECIAGQMTDHYDPRSHVVRLSEDVYHGNSIASLGIAAHEVGHAIQHARSYSPLMLRHMMYPAASIGSKLAWPLIIAGFIFSSMPILLTVGIWMFVASVLFTIITLPVEFNASSRAVAALAHGGYMTDDELAGTRKVLSAAALTYVAAAAAAVLQLIRLILIANSRD